jgi:hypothetical protein
MKHSIFNRTNGVFDDGTWVVWFWSTEERKKCGLMVLSLDNWWKCLVGRIQWMDVYHYVGSGGRCDRHG